MAVSPVFRLDWNYALKVVRIPTFRWASQLIISTPILAQFTPLLHFNEIQVWLLWFASALFLAGFLLLRVRAPLFLQEYANFKAYEECGHSHRWVVWQLHLNFRSFAEPAKIAQETIDKGLSIPTRTTTLSSRVYGACPIFPAPAKTDLELHEPVNLNNDLYLPFNFRGVRYVLPIQELDPCVDSREKEIFWILYTECASSRPPARYTVWLLFLLAALLFFAALSIILYRIWTTPIDPTQLFV